jgi:hypothetical protein
MVSGYSAGAGIAAFEQERLAKQQAMQLAAMKQQQEMMLQQQRQEAFDKALGPNAGIADYRRAAIFGNDEQSKAFLSFAAEQTAEQNRGAISKIASVFYPLVAGNVDASVKALERQKEAYAGNQAAVQEIDNQIAQIQADPKTAQVRLGGMLAEIPGGEKVLENVLSLTKENRAQSEEKRAAELQPSTLMAQTAKARKAVIDSQYADLSARLSMEEKRQNIAAAKQQISDARNAGVKVQSSSILPDGTVILVTTDGQSIVRDPEGNNLTGQSRRDAIFAAKNFGVDEQGQRSGARRGAEIGQKKSEEAFESLDKVNTNIKNMNEAIAAIDGGASTGVISSKLPNVKQASIELNNIKNRLGLDVIGATTFGALSSSEREFALDTAMPTNLQPRELRAWLVRKRDAQAKMSGYLSEQAKYLSKPGRTVGDWLDYQDKKKAGNSVSVNGKTYNKPANFTDAQWQAYKRDMGV